MSRKLAESSEINDIANTIRSKQFLYIVRFADILTRYSEITFGNPLRYAALSVLITRGGHLTPTELAKLMFRSKHSITKIIDALEKEGMAVRVRGKKDRRVIHVKITSYGLEQVRKNMDRGDEIVKEILSSVTRDEMKTLLGLVGKVQKSVVKKMTKA